MPGYCCWPAKIRLTQPHMFNINMCRIPLASGRVWVAHTNGPIESGDPLVIDEKAKTVTVVNRGWFEQLPEERDDIRAPGLDSASLSILLLDVPTDQF